MSMYYEALVEYLQMEKQAMFLRAGRMALRGAPRAGRWAATARKAVPWMQKAPLLKRGLQFVNNNRKRLLTLAGGYAGADLLASYLTDRRGGGAQDEDTSNSLPKGWGPMTSGIPPNSKLRMNVEPRGTSHASTSNESFNNKLRTRNALIRGLEA